MRVGMFIEGCWGKKKAHLQKVKFQENSVEG